MSEICVFAGTGEGRALLEFLAGQDVRVLACVATDYGMALLPKAGNIRISAGWLDADQMRALLEGRCFDMVVDATHPYAARASENIAAACAATGTEYLRLNRADADVCGDAAVVDSIQGAARFLAEHPGNALLATGSRELMPYAGVEDYRERFYVRVLPMRASLEACEAAGFPASHVIAMQGPFSTELNAAMLRAVDARWLVTKASGDSGGFREKLEAARQANARCVVVGRPPQPEGESLAGVVTRLSRRYGLRDVRSIDVVGIGMGAAECMTLEAARALDACDCLIGAPRALEAAARANKPAYARYAPEDILAVLNAHPEYRRAAVVMSGDAGFFSGAKKLLPLLEGHRVRVLPGLSSLQYLCARLQTPWDDVRAVSLHGREGSVVGEVLRHGRVFALTAGADAVRRVCADLCDAGLAGARVTVGQRLSYPDEAILRGTARELAGTDCDPLSALLIEYDARPAPLSVGLPDEAFERADGADGRPVPMTKSEVRAVSISKLRLTENAVVWDVGAGTGSVSVEAALLCPKGHVYAVERDAAAADLIERNARRHALRNLTVVRGSAPEVLKALPAPTHAFIGGSGGGLRGIVRAIFEKRPGARVVANAVTLETACELLRLADECCPEGAECVQLTVARGRKAGAYHMMTGMNPVWILAMQGRCADEY